jgi:hypothetical protein
MAIESTPMQMALTVHRLMVVTLPNSSKEKQ